MNVTCPNCATVYRVDPAKVPESGVRARCAVCNAVFAVRREAEQGQPATPPMASAEMPRAAAAPPAEPTRSGAPQAARPEPSRPAAPA
ncbi:MAG: zinc-ribbon domain-containing protein, partial [Gemmatimonadales bacterium]